MTQPYDVPATRYVIDNEIVQEKLGYLSELAGTWEGRGFNLIARPDFHDKANLYLQLNQTHETLTVAPIGSPIPNRGFGQDDIELFGLSYLQKIHDHYTGGALHLEPGLWITQPPTTYPPENPPTGGQIIARMASIPHGTVVLAQGNAISFTGAPTLRPPDGIMKYHGSLFPSFNSTPFPAGSPVINAHGSSEKKTAGRIFADPFGQYDLRSRTDAANLRTPSLPGQIGGVPMQRVINDPIRLLRAVIEEQQDLGCTFEGCALNIATRDTVAFCRHPNSPGTGHTVDVRVTGAGGGTENILFLEGGEQGPNAQAGLVYATFWLEKVMPESGDHFMQLQYAQMAVLNFPVYKLLHQKEAGSSGRPVILGWPHVSVATLRKAF
jgi:hypothetical protein